MPSFIPRHVIGKLAMTTGTIRLKGLVRTRLSSRPVDWSGYLFITPYMLVYAVFLLLPVVWSLTMTFQRGGALGGLTWCGLCNYVGETSVWTNRLFLQAVRNTVIYTLLVVPCAMLLSLGLAVLIDRLASWLQTLIKVALFLPMVSSVVSLSIIWKALFTPGSNGPLNWLVGLIGIPPQNWLGNAELVIPSIVAFEIWRGYGFWVIVFMAGLSAIPRDLYDAAHVDGADGWQIFRHITLPLLRPTFLFLTVMGVIWNFQIFDAVYMLTSGGPANSSATVVYYVYRNAFHFENLGYAATMGFLLFVVVLIFTVIQLRLLRSDEE